MTDSLLDSILTSSDSLNFIAIFFGTLVSIYIFKKELSISFYKELHNNVISPLFHCLEPVLFQDISEQVLNDALKIIEDNKNLIDGKLLELSYFCSINSSQKNFNELCSYVDKQYDKSCKKLGLKRRSISYRISRHQYKHMGYLFLYVAIYIIKAFTFAIALMFCGACILVFLYSIYHSLTPVKQLIMDILFLLLLLFFLKYGENYF